jgi:hypothetical protein
MCSNVIFTSPCFCQVCVHEHAPPPPTHPHPHTHATTQTPTHSDNHTNVRTPTFTHAHVCALTHTLTQTHTRVHLCVCVCVGVCVYIRHGHTDARTLAADVQSFHHMCICINIRPYVFDMRACVLHIHVCLCTSIRDTNGNASPLRLQGRQAQHATATPKSCNAAVTGQPRPPPFPSYPTALSYLPLSLPQQTGGTRYRARATES